MPRFNTQTPSASSGSAVTPEKYQGRTMNRWFAFTRSQDWPPSSERKMPPVESGASMLAYTTLPSAGDTDTPIRPSGPSGNPGFWLRSVQWSPPSVVFHRPLRPPPALKPHGVLWNFHMAAKITRGLLGSMDRSMAPVLSFRNSTFCHVAPPSSERNTPRSGFGPNAWPNAATKTRSGSFGSTSMSAMWRVSVRPMLRHVFPPSVDL